jgi:hypothetical protein
VVHYELFGEEGLRGVIFSAIGINYPWPLSDSSSVGLHEVAKSVLSELNRDE